MSKYGYNRNSSDGNASVTTDEIVKDSITDLIFDEDGKGHTATIEYEGKNEGKTLRIYYCHVSCNKVFDKQDIEENISFFEGCPVVIENEIIWD